MAKKKPYMVFETKEEFDKQFDKVYHSGEDDGFERGCAYMLSNLYQIIDDQSEEIQRSAQYILGKRRQDEYKKKESAIEYIKEQAILDYLKEKEKNNGKT